MQMSKIGQIAFVAACGWHAHDSAACSDSIVQHEVRKPKFKESSISSRQRGCGIHSDIQSLCIAEEVFPATAFSDSDGFDQKTCCCSINRNEFAISLKARILAILSDNRDEGEGTHTDG